MSDSEKYDAIVIGGGKGGKTLAMYLGKQKYKVALIERDPMMIGGGCINVACIPTKTFIASARLVHSIRRAAEFGVKVEGVSVDWPGVRRRVEEVVSDMRALNLKNFTSVPGLDFILGTGRFLGPQEVEVVQNDNVIRHLSLRTYIHRHGYSPRDSYASRLARCPVSDQREHPTAGRRSLTFASTWCGIHRSRVCSDDASVRKQGHCVRARRTNLES